MGTCRVADDYGRHFGVPKLTTHLFMRIYAYGLRYYRMTIKRYSQTYLFGYYEISITKHHYQQPDHDGDSVND